jgi:mannose-6-phosphate isomerase
VTTAPDDLAVAPEPVTRSARPWGTFDLFVTNHRCTVTIVTVLPGQHLSLQRHPHRDETWHVIEGLLDVVRGDESLTVAPGDHVWIPRGAGHRVSNPSPNPTRVLQIATGVSDEDAHLEPLCQGASRALC